MAVGPGRRLDDQVPPGAEEKGFSPGPQEGSLRGLFAGAYTRVTVGFVGREGSSRLRTSGLMLSVILAKVAGRAGPSSN